MSSRPNSSEGPSVTAKISEAQRLHVVRRMRRAFLSICRCGDTLFSPYGITTDQYSLLRAVQREPGIRQADLGSVIFAEPNTVTAMVTLLEKRGILRRRPSSTDRRAKLVHLTTRGEMLFQRLSNDWDPMRKILNDCFSLPGGTRALEILDTVHDKMQFERKKLMNSVGDSPVITTDQTSPERRPASAIELDT